ncbi:MAG: ABC transporter permease [bacterium]|nr:ABC transporter permease [bacterium]
MIAVFLREVKAYFSSYLAWSLVAAYLVIYGVITAFSLEDLAQISMQAMGGGQPINVMEMMVPPLLSMMGFLLLFFLPLLTMRLFSGEKRSGTLDLLLTYPLTEAQIIGGKLLATMLVVVLMLAFSLSGFIILGKLTSIEWQVVASGYLGLLLLAASFISFGMWVSSLTASQAVSGAATYGGLLIFWILDGIDRTGIIKQYFGDLSPLGHLTTMTKGVIDTQNLVYFIAFSFLFLFLTARVLESRKWRG